MSLLPGTPHCALPLRVSLISAATALLLLMMNRLPPQGLAQSNVEGTVWLTPPISMVDAESGPFTVFVVLEDLQHFGTLSYDDNRDTVPDREVGSAGLGAFEMTIQYDPAVLTFTGVHEGPDLNRSGRSFDCLPPALELDSVSFGCVSLGPEPSGPQGTMTLAALTFEATRSGTSPLVLEAAVTGPLGADTVPIDIRGGIVRVAARPGPKETAPAAGATAGEPPRVTTPGQVQTATTEAAGAQSATPAASGTGERGGPDGLATGGRDGSEGSSAAGNSSGGSMVWLAVALGGASVAALLMLAAVFWRRSYRPGL